MLAARRRLLGMLLALALGSCVLAVTQMAAWWVVVPPVTMLTGYLALLREAAKADAERRELARARATEAATDQAAPPAAATATAVGTAPAAGAAAAAAPAAPVAPAGPAGPAVPAGPAGPAVPAGPAAPPPAAPVPDAEVIDISASVGKEFYDQYADAKLRAVGDLPLPTAV